MTGPVVTIASGKGGVGKATATADRCVALATLGKQIAYRENILGLCDLGVSFVHENRIVYELLGIVEYRARLERAMIKDKRLVTNTPLRPASRSRRLG